jgi:sugar phosphate isomerase/epimerase
MSGFSLDCLTLPDVAPVDLIRAAADAGYASVSLWVQQPAMHDVMLATPDIGPDLAREMANHGITPGNLEVFNLNTDEPIAAFEAAIAFGASLGARSATAIDYGAPRADIAERFAAFAALCAQHDIAPLVEPISMGNVRTPQDGLDLIATAGVDGRLVLDCVHIVRTGCTPEDVRALPAGRIGYLQLCDGPASLTPEEVGIEAMADRLYPGEGSFPLVDIVAAIPEGVPVGLEVPNLARQQRGLSGAERAREAIAAARSVLARVEERAR